MPHLSTKAGQPTGGVYGFMVLSLEIIKLLKPDYICVAWDKSKTNIRSRRKLYSHYKANRKKPPEDFYAQIPILTDLLAVLGWPIYELDDYEADDIMATLAKKADKKGLETILVSSDLDLLQAISPTTKMYALKKGLSNIRQFDAQTFEQEYGIKTSQFVDLKAIMGDSSDNIPGVAGIGRKGAASLLSQYQTLDQVYENLDKLADNVRSKLVKDKEMATLSKKLVTLMADAPVDLELAKMEVKSGLDSRKLREALRDLEFNSLGSQISKLLGVEIEAAPADRPHPDTPSLKYHNSLQDLAQLNWSKPVLLDVYCADNLAKQPIYVIAADSAKEVHVYDVKKSVQLAIKQTKIYGYNTKKAIKFLINHGVTEVTVDHDVHMAGFLLDSLADNSLTGLAYREFQYTGQLDNLDPDSYRQKAADIGRLVMGLAKLQKDQLKQQPKLLSLAKDIEWPVIPVVARIELAGMKVDSGVLKKLHAKLEDHISDLEQTIHGYANQAFNIASPSQLSKVLYEDLQLPTYSIRKGKTGYSTAANQLAKLSKLHPIISHIISYREHTKLKNTYVNALPDHIGTDGRIHTSFSLTVTSTGRLSSSEPNLQNIPVRTELGRLVRQAFVADKGNALVNLDYSQFELRLAAVLSKDASMLDAFNNDLDIHSITASQVFGVPLKEVTKDMRYSAKTVNFGILYGQGSHGLAAQTGMTYVEAQKFIDTYFEQRQALASYIKNLRELAKEQGYVETFFGRRRPTPDVVSANFVVREAAYRQAVNMPIQGTEADLMKMAMIKLAHKLDEDCLQIMQVHDSIIIECPKVKSEVVCSQAKAIMENIYPDLGVRLKVDTHIGESWDQI